METVLKTLANREDLTPRQVAIAADFLLDENGDVSRKAELLKKLSLKGETAAEIAEFVTIFLSRAKKPDFYGQAFDRPTIDVCGTGGDKLDLFNVSTTSMFLVAAAGGVVIKHGNRGITSKSGGADVLEALGVRIDLPSNEVGDCLEKAGVGFLFAPNYHPAFKAVVPVRKMLAEQGHRTIFNLIGPLLNPAKPQCQLVGVFDEKLCPVFVEILQRLQRDSAWAVCGSTAEGGAVDEISLMGPTRICKAGNYEELADYEVTPAEFDLKVASVEELKGGGPQENAKILTDILAGSEQGAKRDMVVLNAGGAIACAGLADSLEDGIQKAMAVIADGSALDRLRVLQDCSRSAAQGS